MVSLSTCQGVFYLPSKVTLPSGTRNSTMRLCTCTVLRLPRSPPGSHWTDATWKLNQGLPLPVSLLLRVEVDRRLPRVLQQQFGDLQGTSIENGRGWSVSVVSAAKGTVALPIKGKKGPGHSLPLDAAGHMHWTLSFPSWCPETPTSRKGGSDPGHKKVVGD